MRFGQIGTEESQKVISTEEDLMSAVHIAAAWSPAGWSYVKKDRSPHKANTARIFFVNQYGARDFVEFRDEFFGILLFDHFVKHIMHVLKKNENCGLPIGEENE